MIKHLFSTDMLFALGALGIAFFLSYILTPLARKLACRCNCYDIPDGKRKTHTSPVPYFGGLAIFGGFFVTVLLFSMLLTNTLPKEIFVTVIGGLAILLVGLLDDIYGMHPVLKFVLQILVATFTAVFGFSIEYITVFGYTLKFGVFAIPVTVLWIVGIINAVNLIDGLNGLAGGVATLESFALLITAVLMGNPICAMAAAALCGATLGFLPFNFGKASIFMGDAGSMLIGYTMACISVSGLFKSQALFSIVVPAMIFALPVLDAITAFVRRIFHGQSPFRADHKHLHYVLVQNGMTEEQSVLLLLSGSALFCFASVMYMKYKIPSVLLFLATMGVLAVFKYDKKLLTKKHTKKNAIPDHTETTSL